MVSRTKEEYCRNLRTEITKVKDSATFWKLVKKLSYRTIPECKITVKEWQIYFQDMYKENTGLIFHLMDARHPYLDQDIQLRELNTTLNKLKPKKAPGPDGITNEFLKYSPHNMRKQLLDLMNRTLHTGEIPQYWTSTNTIMLHKKGNKLDPNNYRGITLANTTTKIFTTILARRLNTWCESCDILPEGQAGFRKDRSCEDNIFVLQTKIAESLRRPKEKLYIVFVDFRKAFDSIWHSILWDKLRRAGVSSQLLRVINNLYQKANTQVKVNNTEFTDSIRLNKGVLQGDSLSPTLFSIMIHDIATYFEAKGHKNIIKEMELLLFADDLTITANNPIVMQEKMETLHSYCVENKLVVNIDKTKLMVCRRSNRKKGLRRITFNGEIIEEVKEYKYLGVTFTKSGTFHTAAKQFITRAKAALGTIWKPLIITRSNRWEPAQKLFDAVVKATLLYNAGTWALNHTETIEKVQVEFIKRMLGVARNTPGYMARLETGRWHLEIAVIKRALGYWKRVESMKDQRFPKMLGASEALG